METWDYCYSPGMSLTDKAIARIRELIQSCELAPGSKLPPEQQLAAELGVGRNLMREAVQALVAARVLEVRRGSGTYVTSLEPRLLLQEGIAEAVELLRGETMLELTEVRRPKSGYGRTSRSGSPSGAPPTRTVTPPDGHEGEHDHTSWPSLVREVVRGELLSDLRSRASAQS
ncbi:FadR/GntR family transcriptional regulator [Nonomuraea sp. JJY05]|uniref:FadR/GntR family transcriptional regulator n=1 Tax=Nonomuraea sp. JJY05 TaxID=3350255 RepID=UPI00373F5DA3